MSDQQSSEDPAQRWVAGDDNQSGFIEALGPSLVRALYARTGDRQLAEDIAQESLAKALVNWDSVRLMDYPQAWVYRVAFNACSSYWRRRRAAWRAERRAAVSDSFELRTAETMAIQDALAGLSRRQSEAVILRHLVGMSVAETAQTMRVAEGTVKTLTHRGIQAMRRALIDD